MVKELVRERKEEDKGESIGVGEKEGEDEGQRMAVYEKEKVGVRVGERVGKVVE